MTYQEACEKAIKSYGPEYLIHTAWDFESFYLFSIAPFYIKDEESYDTGTVFTAVDKETGRVFDYDITNDLNSYFNAKILYPKINN